MEISLSSRFKLVHPWIMQKIPCRLTMIFLVLFATSMAYADPVLEERRIDGTDAKFLAESMAESGAVKIPNPKNEISGDHPALPGTKDLVYRMESVVCRPGKKPNCDSFTVSSEKMKKLFSILKKLGVRETVPPKSAKSKPYYFMKEIICGAETAEGATPVCSVTAHFTPKKN